ncbi:MAG TPA: aminotransferase class I/II-fold pyridoxal phosphate-dependent enzyme [Euzebyales bacterium]
MRPDTTAAHGGGHIDPVTGALTPPIHMSTTFARGADGSLVGGHEYTRADNPTYEQPERLLAALEGCDIALLFSSGMAAVSAPFCALVPGDHVVAPMIMYWGLRKWLSEFALSWGVTVTHVDTTDLDALRAAMRPGRTRLVWIETPANPTWDVTDIAAVAEIAHDAHARLAVDSTVATPVHTRPLAFGADLVVHSATKFLNGHGDVLAGALVTAVDDPFVQRIRAWRRGAGAVPGSMSAWLLLRGMRTLFPRVLRSSENARAIAEHFADDPRLSSVLYPGLASHPGHPVAARQMTDGFGGMLSVRVRGGAAAAAATLARLQVFARATSLGGTESLAEHRAPAEGPSTPVPDDLLRLSIGLEHPDDLIADLDQALDHGVTGRASAAHTPATTPDAARTDAGARLSEGDAAFAALRRTVVARGGDVRRAGGDVIAEGSPGAVEPLRDQLGLPEPDVSTVAGVLDGIVNPSVAAHDGRVVLVDETDGVVTVRLDGRCQGCAMAEVTVRQGIEPLLRRHVPGVRGVVDATDHTAGSDPYYPPTKR